MKCKILLAATVGWPSAARYAGGFVAAACDAAALSPRNAPVRRSRYVHEHYDYSALRPLASFQRAILRSKPDIVVPCDDRAVIVLLTLFAETNHEIVSEIIQRSLGNISNYATVMSRFASLEALRKEGVRIPATFAIPDEEALQSALGETGYPAVLKSDGSWGGEGVAIVRSPEEALAEYRRLCRAAPRWRSLARALRRKDPHYLREALAPKSHAVSLQKFIAGHPAASAFAAHNGKIVAAIGYDVLIADGRIGPPTVIRRVDCPQIQEAARIAARRFELSGLHGLDFIRDANGDVHLLEINPRATQGGTLAFGPGRDLPAALAATLSPQSSGMRPAIGTDLVAFFPRAWKRDGCDFLAAAHHDIPWDDPAVLTATLGLSQQANDNDLRARVYAKLEGA